MFRSIRIFDKNDVPKFALWCNGEGHDVVATMYSTIVYLAHANRIRSELPFIELQPGEDRTLLEHLSNVRKSLGGEYGIWEVLQDSLGSYYVGKDGVTATYREFCIDLIDNYKHVWFLRLIDFYADIDQKLGSELARTLTSLETLAKFLATKPGPLDITLLQSKGKAAETKPEKPSR